MRGGRGEGKGVGTRRGLGFLGRGGLAGVWFDRLTRDAGWNSAGWLLLGPGRERRDDDGGGCAGRCRGTGSTGCGGLYGIR